jgi:hypothetical protein
MLEQMVIVKRRNGNIFVADCVERSFDVYFRRGCGNTAPDRAIIPNVDAMTPDEDEYRFELDAFTPATIPMSRLAEYMAEVAALFANPTYVHFSHLEPGSTALVARVDPPAIPKVAERVHQVELAEEGSDLRKIYREIDRLAAEDNAVGRLKRRQSGAKTDIQIIYFPGRERPKPERIGPFTQPAVFDGIALRSGGKDETANVLIELDDGRIISGEVTREKAAEIGKYLYQSLRFQGEARWVRLESGEWELVKFRIKSFLKLDKDSVVDGIAKLREIGDSEWDKVPDPIRLIRDSRIDQDDDG